MSYVLDGLFKPIDHAWLRIRRRWARECGVARDVALGRLGTVTVDIACDFTGETCLRTNLLTQMTLDQGVPGAVVEIATDNLASVETIPFMLPGHGFEHLATIRSDSGWRIYARKGEARR